MVLSLGHWLQWDPPPNEGARVPSLSKVTGFRLTGLGRSCDDSVTASVTCTVCAQICTSVSQALTPDPHINPMRTALTPQGHWVQGEAHRL